MKKYILITLICFVSTLNVFSNPEKTFTILYLLPFHTEDTTNIQIENMQCENDIYSISAFEMLGFWEGSLLALETFESENFKLNIIVRDLVTQEEKLDTIFNNKEMIEEVDLVIGPFYGTMFSKAATYCDSLKIPIVNPFSTSRTFASEHSSVYKITPPIYTIPAAVADTLLSQYPNYHVTLWCDSTQNSKLKTAYNEYFTTRGVPFSESSDINIEDTTIQNIVIALYEDESHLLSKLPQIANHTKNEKLTLVFPESWLKNTNLDWDFYTLPELYYLSQYHIDKSNVATQLFELKYTERFSSPPRLSRYSYQGYDITHYFITQLLLNNNIPFEAPELICYRFNFKELEKGGKENHKIRLMKIVDLLPTEIH